MITYYGKLDICFDADEVKALEIDISDNTEHFSVLLDALEYRLIKSINIKDKDNKLSITMCINEKTEFLSASHELRLTVEQIELIKKLICDVAIGKSFSGYHEDFEIPSKNGILNLCVLLTDWNNTRM